MSTAVADEIIRNFLVELRRFPKQHGNQLIVPAGHEDRRELFSASLGDSRRLNQSGLARARFYAASADRIVGFLHEGCKQARAAVAMMNATIRLFPSSRLRANDRWTR